MGRWLRNQVLIPLVVSSHIGFWNMISFADTMNLYESYAFISTNVSAIR